MDRYTLFTIALLVQIHLGHSWTCSQNEDCVSRSGSVCVNGECVCEPGQQVALGGTACINVAPYHASPCVEDFQCNRLLSGFHCRKNNNSTEGNCMCQSDHHYFRGRCWKTIGFGQPCSRDEECLGDEFDPFSMLCNVTCQCSDNYFEKQRGHCRKYAAEGEACVIDQDCQFEEGTCDKTAFICTNGTQSDKGSPFKNLVQHTHNKISKVHCNTTTPCNNPFVCSNWGICICPFGYYESETDNSCLAELGSPSTPEQCVGFLAEVVDGICTCRSNFFYDENMRDCVKVTRSWTDSCLSDAMCGTFGPSRCEAEAASWGIRNCACHDSVWDPRLYGCRYFAVIGERCEVDSDCLAGEQEIQCVKNDDGNSYCKCPQGLLEHEGLCLNTGLKLGDSCQHNLECTGTDNTECDSGVCSCVEGYQKAEGEGNETEAFCAPMIGSSCVIDSDCVINNTICKNDTASSTCQCRESFVQYDEMCWPKSDGYNASCSVTEQCSIQNAACLEERCVCKDEHHFNDGDCWPITGLFLPCSRSSQCYLDDHPERVVCRNSACQCHYDYPFSEELNTCSSSSTSHIAAVLFVIIAAIHTLT